MRDFWRIFFGTSIVFLLHFFWEMAHAGLYVPHFLGIADFIFIHLRAAFGDVVLTALVYFFGALFFRDTKWFLERRFSPHAFTTFCSFLVSVFVEKIALLSGRWEYSPLMPLLPFLHVGVSPVLQFVGISLVTLSFFRFVYKNRTGVTVR